MGSGKSPAYLTAALAAGLRVAILTESKGLQDQVQKDFGCIGLFDMRGLQNYTCRALSEGGELEDMWAKKWGRPTCNVGPCTAGLRCDLKNSGCDYFDDYRRACAARIVSTNYAYWIAIHKYGQGLGKFDWLIIDECHAAGDQLSAAMSVEFNHKDFKELESKPPKATAPLQNWRMWGRVQLARIQGKLEFFQRGAKIGQTVGADGVVTLIHDTDIPDASELKFWKNLEGKCSMLSESTDDWVTETDESNGNIRIAPVWVRKYAESHLFLNIPRVIMMSATVRPKIKDLLSIPNDNCVFTEYPSTFSVERRPIYWIPTVRLNYESPQEDLRTWAVRIDQILGRRLDRKGIVHTVSYARQKYLLEHSRFRDYMYHNTPGNAQEVVKAFRAAAAPAVLVSPSVGTGFDFVGNQARFQIIGKVPFRDARGAILKSQVQEDPDYLNYLTAQDLIQTSGRVVRSPDDFAETFILDDSIEWFLKQYSGYPYNTETGRFVLSGKPRPERNFFPKYFLEAFQRIDSVIDPPSLESITTSD